MAEDRKSKESLLDEAAKAAASGVSRREVLRRLGLGLAGTVLASMGLQDRATAARGGASGSGGGTSSSSCPAGYTKCKGQCVSLSSNPSNCGACGHGCSTSSPYCVNGACSPCPSGLTLCNGACVNLTGDISNCGACGHNCGSGLSFCSGGACYCYYTVCGTTCTDVTTDANNCGACGNSCSDPTMPYCAGGVCSDCFSGGALCSGVCTDIGNDPNNCGDCGIACPAGYACGGGSCYVSCTTDSPYYPNC
jgi:hypothetical protein